MNLTFGKLFSGTSLKRLKRQAEVNGAFMRYCTIKVLDSNGVWHHLDHEYREDHCFTARFKSMHIKCVRLIDDQGIVLGQSDCNVVTDTLQIGVNL